MLKSSVIKNVYFFLRLMRPYHERTSRNWQCMAIGVGLSNQMNDVFVLLAGQPAGKLAASRHGPEPALGCCACLGRRHDEHLVPRLQPGEAIGDVAHHTQAIASAAIFRTVFQFRAVPRVPRCFSTTVSVSFELP